MLKVYIAPATLIGVEASYARLLRDAGFELVVQKFNRQLHEDEILTELAGACACIAGSEPYTRRVLAANPQLRCIARAGVGYDAVDLQAATEHGVAVAFAPGTNQDAVAEHTFTLILALAKNLIRQHSGTIAYKWPRQANLPLRGCTLGIAGMGRIGKAVAIRGAAFGMKLLAFEPFPDKNFVEQYRVTLVPMDRLLAESDYLSLHMPLTSESKHLINRKTLALMKPTSFLINTARGGLVCEADLIEVLQHRGIAGAGLDVFEDEPPGKSFLFELDNVVFTPHAAGVDLRSRDDMAEAAAQTIVALSRGQWPTEQIVNPQVRERFKW
jgi:D-3-phosphoglycerate dehydrogenase